MLSFRFSFRCRQRFWSFVFGFIFGVFRTDNIIWILLLHLCIANGGSNSSLLLVLFGQILLHLFPIRTVLRPINLLHRSRTLFE